ncbi:glycoside hydrolase family 16 protein [Mucilaginibacter psychrotolerans]|uniref:Glycoside hydrolase family 16 protein n=1 Tax=Mucilaginibacter psychrotolerans TaxID=1524096 RepID=A0A4Y8SHQ4_9SPHI|nr:glycoside hydrolase family 16 protein [Mucilaginibacter psychrotolerans]TFF38559.1 glycoside hydrolase family 16 protein [Mucilaginibacter psychrotolerans]
MLFKKNLLAAATAAILALPAFSQTKKAAPTAKGTGQVIFFDDFSGNKLDRSKWTPIVTGFHTNGELQAYVDSTNVISFARGAAAEGAHNGALVLSPKYSAGFKTFDGQTFDFISGRITTIDKFDFTYGTAEARIKLVAADGLWPAWWMLGYPNWPTGGETDIMEFIGEADWVSAAVHGPGYSGETPFVNRMYLHKNNDATQWHTYAVDWTPESLVFKYDGVTMFRVTKTMAEHYGKWVFTDKQYLLLNFAVGGIYPYKINGLKKPYYGLSEKALGLIKTNKAKMLVDWVRVTKR